jgi:phospholipid/cholesterol/gamma-HCH transport system permease protein
MPKILAAFIVIPSLVILSMFLTVWGGYMAGTMTGIITDAQFHQGLIKDFLTFNIVFGIIKAFTFAFIITSISAYFGYNVQGGSLEIGRASTTSVIVSCVLILFADYGLAALLLTK